MTSTMYLVAGLGNPGEEYAHTRHNAGFDTVDEIAREANVSYWKNECGAFTAKVRLAGEEVLLAKPQSYMNTSGGPVKKLMEAHGVDAEHLIVVHDDLDIEPASIRVKFGGGLAGHNGLKSIAEKLGVRDWYRVRVGIGRPPGRMPVVDFVLTKPRKEAADDFAQGCYRASLAVESLIRDGLQKTQQEFN